MANLRDLLFQETAGETRTAAATADGAAHPAGKKEAAPARKQSATLSLTSSVLDLVPAASTGSYSTVYSECKHRIHNRLVESIDIAALVRIQGGTALEAAIEKTIQGLLADEDLPLTASEQRSLVRDVLNETLGLGPLEPLLADSSINDILVNRFDDVWVDRNGKLEPTDIKFSSEDHLIHVINRIVARVGRRVDESSPIVDARLPDGSRVNAIIPPLALDGPILSIRRFRPVPFSFEDLVRLDSLSSAMADFLSLAVKARLNVLIAGGTSAGKTTLLNVLSGFISDSERIVTIEDTAELRLQQRHVLRLESRPANIEGQGSVSQRELVKNALRMRPDRIVVGEVRGAEALDMLQAMNTGHEGSLTTVHANSPRDALSRLETLVLLSGIELSQRSIREQIASAFDLVVQIKRLSDGKRRVVSVAEITGMEEGVISMQELFVFRAAGIDEQGRLEGRYTACGIRPQCEEKFHEAGIQLNPELFAENGAS
jgi:pilus assembly protein CpaF